MATGPYSEVDRGLYPATVDPNPSAPAIAWSAVSAGTVAAIAVTLTLLMLGTAFGLGAASPWPGVGAKPSTFTIGAGLWLVITQWLSAAMGGYIAGRLRVRWHGLHTDEVFFRDTAHGFLTWATATVIVAIIAVAASALSSIAAGPVDMSVTKEAADEARKVAATFAGFTGVSLVIGAFIGSVAGAIGGGLRDKHP
jgi:hypothetical protein